MKDIENIIRRLNTHHWAPERGETAILLIDLQEYFRGLINPILVNLKSIVATARKKRIPLFFTQHGHKSGQEKGMLGRWWPDLIIEGSDEAVLLPELEVGQEEIVIPKNTYSAFFKTRLEAQLKEQKIKDLVIGGVMTNLCCETSAREAFVRDFRVFFLADGTATASNDLHLASLKNLAYGISTLISCKNFTEILKSW